MTLPPGKQHKFVTAFSQPEVHQSKILIKRSLRTLSSLYPWPSIPRSFTLLRHAESWSTVQPFRRPVTNKRDFYNNSIFSTVCSCVAQTSSDTHSTVRRSIRAESFNHAKPQIYMISSKYCLTTEYNTEMISATIEVGKQAQQWTFRLIIATNKYSLSQN